MTDERAGFRVAEQSGLQVTGTLGVLDLAADRGLVDFAAAILALEQTSFRRPGALLRVLLAKHESVKENGVAGGSQLAEGERSRWNLVLTSGTALIQTAGFSGGEGWRGYPVCL